MENQANKLTLSNAIGVIVFPAKYIEEAHEKLTKSGSWFIWILAMSGVMLPKGLAESQVSPLGALYWPIWVMLVLVSYFPVTYVYGYLLWRLGKGFGGTASFEQIRNTVIFSMLPVIVNLPFEIIYAGIAINRNDIRLASHQSTLVNWIIWLVGFRILMVGIARFNRFSKTQTLIVWFLVALLLSAIQGLLYLARQ